MNAKIFLQVILTEFYNSIHRLEDNNYDYHIFNKQLERSFNSERHINFAQYFFDHYSQFYATYMLLKNQSSRELFFKLICYRLLGHNHININGLRSNDLDSLLERVRQYQAGNPHFAKAEMMGHKIQAFKDYPFNEHKLHFESIDLNLIYGCELKQYFYDRDGIQIKPEIGDVVIDAGSCMGETSVVFAAATGETGYVHGFDMSPLHLAMTQYNIDQNGFTDRFKMVGYGLANVSQGTEVKADADQTSVNPSKSLHNENNLPTITLDDYVTANSIDKVNFIKMDIEGAEMAALQGAAKTIQTHRPKLAISIYHKLEDYLTIPHHLATECPFYDFYLDHYTIYDQETVLYAIARD